MLVTFARPEESRAFRRRLVERENLRGLTGNRVVTGKIGTKSVVVAHTGIGLPAATQSIRELLKSPWNLVIAAGFAGALSPNLREGDIISQDTPDPNPLALISRPVPIERAEDKKALYHRTGASAVDMETASIAAACHEAGVPITAIRAISDPAHVDLPVPFAIWFDLARQRPRPFTLLAFLARHPTRIRPFLQFVRRLPRISASLASALETRIRSLASPPSES